MVFGFGGRNNTRQTVASTVVNVVASTPLVPLPIRLTAELDKLAIKVRANGNDIPTAVYSKLRIIDDVLRSLLKYIASQGASTEQEVFLENMVTKYIPDALNAYLNLSPADKGDNSNTALLLLQQYDTLELKARDLANQVRTGAIAELSIQATFIDEKFAHG
jgi:hypothetical protein